MDETIGLATFFGAYVARMISFETRPLVEVYGKVDSGFVEI